MTTSPSEGPPGFARAYGVELLFTGQPDFDQSAFRRVIERELPTSEVTVVPNSGFMVAHNDDVVNFSDGSKPATTAVMIGKPGVDLAGYSEALAQTWEWRDEARERLAKCSHSVLVTDLLSAQLPSRRRIELVLRVVRAACAASPVSLLAWHPAGKLHDPAHLDDLAGVVINARMFRDQAGSSRLIMDTLGLAAVGLPDIQIDFSGLEPGRVAGWLHGVGGYLLDHGDAIEDGHTVAGIPKDSKWRCRHEIAIVPPQRVVLDVDPGPAHSIRRRD